MSATRGLGLMLLLGAAVTPTVEKPALRYQPRADEDRPVPVAVTVGPQEGRLALKVLFNQPPWGEDCKVRCANTTLFFDLDSNRSTGLQLGQAVETGADIAVIIQGVREYKELSGESRLRVKVRQFLSNARSVEEGATFVEFDLRRDRERLKSEDRTVYVLIDIAEVDVPAARRLRLVYHPAGGTPVQADGPGMTSVPPKVKVFPVD